MPATKAFGEHYRILSDAELQKLAAEGGLTAEAEQALRTELGRRNLTFDEAKRHFAPEWLDNAEAGALGVLTFANGERITAQIVGLNEGGDRLSVQGECSRGRPDLRIFLHGNEAAMITIPAFRTRGLRIASPYLRPALKTAAKQGRPACVVNISSHAGARPAGASIPYAISKAALNHMTRLLASSLGPHIRVNAVAPGLG